MQYDILVSDFGESKRLVDDDRVFTSAGDRVMGVIGAWMPNEVRQKGDWSAKTDVYCFAVIAEMMLRTRIAICTVQGSQEERVIPVILGNVLKKCLVEEAAMRPQMSEVRDELEKLSWQIDDGEAEWMVLDAHEEPLARKYSSGISDLGLSS